MVKVCCVKGCRSESYGNCGISFHKVPKDITLRAKWAEAIGGSDRIRNYSTVCSLHFKIEDFKPTIKAKLKDNAVPCVVPPAPKLITVPRDITVVVAPQDNCESEGSYSFEEPLELSSTELENEVTKRSIGSQTLLIESPNEICLKNKVRCLNQKLARRNKKIKNMKNALKTPNTTQEAVSEFNIEDFGVPQKRKKTAREIRDPVKTFLVDASNFSSHLFSSGDDEFDLFGRTVAQQLRRLPLVTALETKEMILSVVSRQCIKSKKIKHVLSDHQYTTS